MPDQTSTLDQHDVTPYSIRLPDDLYNQLRAEARRRDLDLAELIRSLLRAGLRQSPGPEESPIYHHELLTSVIFSAWALERVAFPDDPAGGKALLREAQEAAVRIIRNIKEGSH